MQTFLLSDLYCFPDPKEVKFNELNLNCFAICSLTLALLWLKFIVILRR